MVEMNLVELRLKLRKSVNLNQEVSSRGYRIRDIDNVHLATDVGHADAARPRARHRASPYPAAQEGSGAAIRGTVQPDEPDENRDYVRVGKQLHMRDSGDTAKE